MRLSQAGGALFQIVGIAFALAGGGFLPAWLLVLVGAVVLVVGAFVGDPAAARRGTSRTSPASPRRRAGCSARSRTASGRSRLVPPRPSDSPAFQMLRYQFWGFGLFVFALYAKNLVEGGAESQVAHPVVRRRRTDRRGAGVDRRAEAEGPRAPAPAAAGVDGAPRDGNARVRRPRLGRRVRVDALRRLLLVLPRQDLRRHDRAAGDARRFPRPGVRAVRHRLQPRVHHPGVHPVPRVGRGQRRDGRGRSCSRRAPCSWCSPRSSPRGRVGSAASSRPRTTWSRSVESPTAQAGVPNTTMEVTSPDAVRLHVEVEGTGEPVTVFAHGLTNSCMELAAFTPFAPGTTVRFCFRGHGHSSAPEPAATGSPTTRPTSTPSRAPYGATNAVGTSLGAGAIMRSSSTPRPLRPARVPAPGVARPPWPATRSAADRRAARDPPEGRGDRADPRDRPERVRAGPWLREFDVLLWEDLNPVGVARAIREVTATSRSRTASCCGRSRRRPW